MVVKRLKRVFIFLAFGLGWCRGKKWRCQQSFLLSWISSQPFTQSNALAGPNENNTFFPVNNAQNKHF